MLHLTNEKNKKRLVSVCYFLARLNNKFINGVKAEVGLLLDASGTSSSAIETLAGAGLTVRRETIARQISVCRCTYDNSRQVCIR